jgi:hypothetical protein
MKNEILATAVATLVELCLGLLGELTYGERYIIFLLLYGIVYFALILDELLIKLKETIRNDSHN